VTGSGSVAAEVLITSCSVLHSPSSSWGLELCQHLPWEQHLLLHLLPMLKGTEGTLPHKMQGHAREGPELGTPNSSKETWG
jgi:hypothetical protein